MALTRTIPGVGTQVFEHLLLDLNGTTTIWGAHDERLPKQLGDLGKTLTIHLLSADTYGTLEDVAAGLGISGLKVADGEAKMAAVKELGAERCVAIGNGSNDAMMLRTAALGIAIIGPEGASARAVEAADVLSPSIVDALDMLLDESGIAATLRL